MICTWRYLRDSVQRMSVLFQSKVFGKKKIIIMIGLWQRATARVGKRKLAPLKFHLLNDKTDCCFSGPLQTCSLLLFKPHKQRRLLLPSSLFTLCLFKIEDVIGTGRISFGSLWAYMIHNVFLTLLVLLCLILYVIASHHGVACTQHVHSANRRDSFRSNHTYVQKNGSEWRCMAGCSSLDSPRPRRLLWGQFCPISCGHVG